MTADDFEIDRGDVDWPETAANLQRDVNRLTAAIEDALDILGDRGNTRRRDSAVTVLRAALAGEASKR